MPALLDPVVYCDCDRIREGRPGLHALIVGVSAYPNLPRRDEPEPKGGFPENTLQLRQLDSAALGACRIARWLIAHHDQLTPPLASVRLLLTPSAGDTAAPDGPTGFAVPNPTVANLKEAADRWRAAAQSHPDSTTLFYFAGHGAQRRIGDHVLLLHDFGKTRRMLESAIDTVELIDGMRVSPTRKNLARRQLYFFDACKFQPEVFKDFEHLDPSKVWDEDTKAVATDDRQYATFYATLPGQQAYGNVGGHSLFCEALLRCFNGGAAERAETLRPSAPLPWRLTVGSLQYHLPRYLKSVARHAAQTQELDAHLHGDFQFRIFAAEPEIEIKIHVDPGHATKCARLTLLSDVLVKVKQVGPPLASNPQIVTVPAGAYILQAADCGVPRRYTDQTILVAAPPWDEVAVLFQAAN